MASRKNLKTVIGYHKDDWAYNFLDDYEERGKENAERLKKEKEVQVYQKRKDGRLNQKNIPVRVSRSRKKKIRFLDFTYLVVRTKSLLQMLKNREKWDFLIM